MQVKLNSDNTINLQPESLKDMHYLMAITANEVDLSFGADFSDVSVYDIPDSKQLSKEDFTSISDELSEKFAELVELPGDSTYASSATLNTYDKKLVVYYNTLGFEISGELCAGNAHSLEELLAEAKEDEGLKTAFDIDTEYASYCCIKETKELKTFIEFMQHQPFSGNIEVRGGGDSGSTYINLDDATPNLLKIIESKAYKNFSCWLEHWTYNAIQGVDWYNNEGGQADGKFMFDPNKPLCFEACFYGNVNDEDSLSIPVAWPSTTHDQLSNLQALATN